MKIKFDYRYFSAFFIFCAVEVFIAIFTKNSFIRNNLGDVLVVILIYCFIKSFIRNDIKLLWFYIFIFATLVEIGQYFNFVDLIGLGDYKIARIILGTTFDIKDIVCYFVGSVLIFLFEKRL